VIIGTSTGGPVALQAVLTQVPPAYPFPVLVLQHMPAGFTGAFAERLNQLCRATVREARDHDLLKPGLVLVAPGGQQTTVVNRHGTLSVRVEAGDPGLRYKPSVDLSFRSAAEQVGGQVLALVLTGMGADGREGARALKAKGAEVWAQDEASSVVYGMPMAVKEAGLADQVLPLAEMGPRLAQVH
jgi:two-component system chemotaxis response regulator CheB